MAFWRKINWSSPDAHLVPTDPKLSDFKIAAARLSFVTDTGLTLLYNYSDNRCIPAHALAELAGIGVELNPSETLAYVSSLVHCLHCRQIIVDTLNKDLNSYDTRIVVARCAWAGIGPFNPIIN